ncbi:hypothetical protein GJ496_004695 [Pomphorhynchus laevis]|nr:hypothetical protein GJ496_004695 [Pomphorhynchus laevis]
MFRLGLRLCGKSLTTRQSITLLVFLLKPYSTMLSPKKESAYYTTCERKIRISGISLEAQFRNTSTLMHLNALRKSSFTSVCELTVMQRRNDIVA